MTSPSCWGRTSWTEPEAEMTTSAGGSVMLRTRRLPVHVAMVAELKADVRYSRR